MRYATSGLWRHRKSVDRTGWVYFVRGAGLIKIGTTRVVSQRLNDLRSASPVPLELMLAIPGGREIEWHIQQQHLALRSHGEWFREAPSLLAHIERLQMRRTNSVHGSEKQETNPCRDRV